MTDKKIQYIPVKGFILSKPIKNDSQSGQWQVHDTNETPQRAECLAIGEETFYETIDRPFPCPVKKGDIFIHSSFGFEDIVIHGEAFRLVPFGKVLAIQK